MSEKGASSIFEGALFYVLQHILNFFLPKLLHMSDKCSTFAPEIGKT
jgi:hypothetical protein